MTIASCQHRLYSNGGCCCYADLYHVHYVVGQPFVSVLHSCTDDALQPIGYTSTKAADQRIFSLQLTLCRCDGPNASCSGQSSQSSFQTNRPIRAPGNLLQGGAEESCLSKRFAHFAGSCVRQLAGDACHVTQSHQPAGGRVSQSDDRTKDRGYPRTPHAGWCTAPRSGFGNSLEFLLFDFEFRNSRSKHEIQTHNAVSFPSKRSEHQSSKKPRACDARGRQSPEQDLDSRGKHQAVGQGSEKHARCVAGEQVSDRVHFHGGKAANRSPAGLVPVRTCNLVPRSSSHRLLRFPASMSRYLHPGLHRECTAHRHPRCTVSLVPFLPTPRYVWFLPFVFPSSTDPLRASAFVRSFPILCVQRKGRFSKGMDGIEPKFPLGFVLIKPWNHPSRRRPGFPRATWRHEDACERHRCETHVCKKGGAADSVDIGEAADTGKRVRNPRQVDPMEEGRLLVGTKKRTIRSANARKRPSSCSTRYVGCVCVGMER